MDILDGRGSGQPGFDGSGRSWCMQQFVRWRFEGGGWGVGGDDQGETMHSCVDLPGLGIRCICSTGI